MFSAVPTVTNTNNNTIIFQQQALPNTFKNTPYLCPDYQIPTHLKQFKPLHPCTSGLTMMTLDRVPSRRSAENGHFYCGRYNMYNVPNCDGCCGPTNGPNCQACRRADDMVGRGTATLNLDQVYCWYSCETHSFYCNRNVLYNVPNCDGYCGPTNGPNCNACRGLDELKRNGYIQIDEATGVVSHYSFSANHFYCGRAVMQRSNLCDGYCGPTDGPQCNLCANTELRLRNYRPPQPVSPLILVQRFQEIFYQVTQQQNVWLQQQLAQMGYNPNWVVSSIRDSLHYQVQQACLQQQIPFNEVEFQRHWINGSMSIDNSKHSTSSRITFFHFL